MVSKRTLELKSLWQNFNLGTGSLKFTKTDICPDWPKEDEPYLTEISSRPIWEPGRRIWVQLKIPEPLYWASDSIYGPLSYSARAAYWKTPDGRFGRAPSRPPGLAFISDALCQKAPSQLVPSKIVPYDHEGFIVNAGLFSNFPAGNWEEKSVKQARQDEFRRVARQRRPECYVLNFCSNDDGWSSFIEVSKEGLGPYHELQYTLMLGVGLINNVEEYCSVVGPEQEMGPQ